MKTLYVDNHLKTVAEKSADISEQKVESNKTTDKQRQLTYSIKMICLSFRVLNTYGIPFQLLVSLTRVLQPRI